MNNRSTKIDQLVQQLTRLTGEDVETALERAIEERLSRIATAARVDRKAAMETFFDQVSRMPVLDPRPADVDEAGTDDMRDGDRIVEWRARQVAVGAAVEAAVEVEQLGRHRPDPAGAS